MVACYRVKALRMMIAPIRAVPCSLMRLDAQNPAAHRGYVPSYKSLKRSFYYPVYDHIAAYIIPLSQ